MLILSLSLLACNGADETPVGPAPTLTIEPADRALTELAVEAVALAPAWLRQDLALNLRQLDSTLQDEAAMLIVDADDPWLYDELAFSIAHLSPEVFDKNKFHPEVLKINAEGLYARDMDLEYVELVDYGEPGVDDDYYTTAVYKVAVEGEVIEREIDPEIYYWYVVHPRIEDEHPYFIDAFKSCSLASLECGKDPSEGSFWREFLWEGAEAECPEGDFCPVLRDYMGDATVLWDEADPGTADGAIASIMSYMLHSDESYGRWLNFGALSERSIQPNRIYGLGHGNCGEWSDMTTAIARTALVPNLNVNPSSWDHTWNAFYAPGSDLWGSEWIPWEPVNWWLVHAYGSGFSTYTTRGDAYSWHFGDYTSTFDMQVQVTDADGEPVDGAYVSIWSPYGESWWFGGEIATGADGIATVPLGAEQSYAIQVGSDIGFYPDESSITYASDGVLAGETDVMEVQLGGQVPRLAWAEAQPDSGAAEIAASLTVAGARVLGTSWRFDESFSMVDQVDAPPIFLVDADNYAALRAGEPFEGAPLDGAISVEPAGSWYVVAPNVGSLRTALLGTLQVDVRPGEGADWEDDVSASLDVELLAGDSAAIRIDFP